MSYNLYFLLELSYSEKGRLIVPTVIRIFVLSLWIDLRARPGNVRHYLYHISLTNTRKLGLAVPWMTEDGY